MFQFRAFPSYDYLIHRTIPEYCSGVLPHSEISGSTLICSSPKLFAACHVLLRLLMPRHSPCALISLTILWFSEELCRSQKFTLARIVVFYPIISTIVSLLFSSSTLCCLSSFSSSFPLFSFQGADPRSKTGSKRSKGFERFDPFSGGDNRNRTDDLLRAKQALSHLSYTPRVVVGQSGLEPPTSRLSVVCSSQLRYWPVWWRLAGSNR